MSYSTVVGVIPDKRPVRLAEFSNAHGWGPSIWRRLLAHHGERSDWFLDDKGLLRLWHKIETLPKWQQIPLVLTFDTGVIPCTVFRVAANQLEEFDSRLPSPEGYANHVPAMVDLLRKNPEVPLLGVYGTSVTENPFDPWDEDADAPGTGISLGQMYVLDCHYEDIAKMFPKEIKKMMQAK